MHGFQPQSDSMSSNQAVATPFTQDIQPSVDGGSMLQVRDDAEGVIG